jgi:hypothetical protein
MALNTLGITVQLFLLWSIWRLSYIESDSVFHRYFNPFCFFALFYLLFFLVEQIYYLATIGQNYPMVGHELFPLGSPQAVYTTTQLALLLFLLGVLSGTAWSRLYLRPGPKVMVPALLRQTETQLEKVVMWSFFAIGLAAIAYLGNTLTETEGFRSALVKTTGGQIATSVSFFGNFAFSALLFRGLRNRNYAVALALIVLFGAATLYTGARGRFLWPTVFAFILLFSSRDVFPKKATALLTAALLFALILMDPLRKVLTDPVATLTFDDFQSQFSALIEKRNFDGFTNFALILNSDAVPIQLSNLLVGGRELFIGTFFPDIYDMGVAMGSTLPGYLYMGGGLAGLLVSAVLFGGLLGIINVWVRGVRRRWTLLSYLFGIVWVTQVGGDTIESIDKMVVAMSPGFVMNLLNQVASDLNNSATRRLEARQNRSVL